MNVPITGNRIEQCDNSRCSAGSIVRRCLISRVDAEIVCVLIVGASHSMDVLEYK